eukprot:858209_1
MSPIKRLNVHTTDNSINPNSNDHQPPDDITTNEDINRKNEGKGDDDQDDQKMDPYDVDDNEYYYRNIQYSYSPNCQYKAQSFVVITKHFINSTIPNNVRETIAHLHTFINKSTVMVHHCGNRIYSDTDCGGECIIYNYE